MPKAKKKVAKTTKKTVKKSVARKSAPKKAMAMTAPMMKKSGGTFSQEFTNALLVIFGAGMVLFAYVIFKIYG
jgi:hypothetical protein